MKRERRHRCFQIQVDDKTTVRVHGDPKMSEETRQALIRVAKAAAKYARKPKRARSRAGGVSDG